MEKERASFYNVNEFPFLKELSEKWMIIRDEFLKLEAPVMELNRVDKEHEEVFQELQEYIQNGNAYGWTQGWGKNGPNNDWVQYGLMIHDEVIPFISNEMNQTLSMLDRIKGIKIAAIVTMNPQSSLPCHRHPEIFEEGLLQMHLPIETSTFANYSYLNVNGEFRQHVCGIPIIFDGSLDHFALNESPAKRTILYLEFYKNRE